MKFALVNGEKVEAIKGARGTCQACGTEMIARCGKVKIHHWAHKSKQNCDPWWENETPWHREWKNCFDVNWQEILHKDDSTGEIHIADVTTPHGWTIEIQHSPMDDEERKSRNNFYKKIAWVVDGTGRKTDIDQLSRLLSSSIKLNTKFPTFAVNPDNKNRLLAEWHSKDSLVFFDFKQIGQDGKRVIWFALPKVKLKDAYTPEFANDLFIQAFPVSMFIGSHINGVFDQFFTREIYEHVLDYCKELHNIRRRYKSERFPDSRLSWLIAD
jgi:competence protein CoiA